MAKKKASKKQADAPADDHPVEQGELKEKLTPQNLPMTSIAFNEKKQQTTASFLTHGDPVIVTLPGRHLDKKGKLRLANAACEKAGIGKQDKK